LQHAFKFEHYCRLYEHVLIWCNSGDGRGANSQCGTNLVNTTKSIVHKWSTTWAFQDPTPLQHTQVHLPPPKIHLFYFILFFPNKSCNTAILFLPRRLGDNPKKTKRKKSKRYFRNTCYNMRVFSKAIGLNIAPFIATFLAFTKPNCLVLLISHHLAYQEKHCRKAMGNCLVLQENVVKIVKTDGKILEYKTPIKVEEVLVQFSGHAVSESLTVLRYLEPQTKLVRGQLYYLVALPPPSPKTNKKVRFADPEVQDVQKSSVVRIKLVISKQELQNMLQNEGFSVSKMLSLVHEDKGEDLSQKNEDVSQGWKPALESIPEVK